MYSRILNLEIPLEYITDKEIQSLIYNNKYPDEQEFAWLVRNA